MSCALTTGFLRGCNESEGGVLEFYFGNKVSDFSATADSTGKITSISGTSLEYYKYEVEPETCNLVQTHQNNPANGMRGVDQVVTLVLNYMEQEKRQEIINLAKGLLSVIVKDSNGKYWLVGIDRGVRMSQGGTAQTGTAFADRNGYSLNFIAKETEEAPEVAYSAFSSLIQ